MVLQGVGVTKLGRFGAVFNEEQDRQLADHIKKLDDYFYGLCFKDLRRLAYEFAERNKLQHPFNEETKLAGKEWALNFLKRHKLSLRTPSRTSLARIMGFNKAQVDVFFKNLEELIAKHKFPPSRIYNMDESGINTVPNKAPKVVSPRGKKCVGKVSSAERGQLTTVICTVSASGNYVPPVIIFARKRLKPELMNGAPPDSLMLCSDSGYSNSDLFPIWLQHFQKHVQSSDSNPVLLVLDNHSSHISIEAVMFCRENSIHLLSLPPHSSHKMQPLDKCLFKPLKEYFSQMCDKWLLNHPGRVITQYQVAELFGEAYETAATMGKGILGFKSCGIYPLNPHMFTEDDFLPSSVTDQTILEETNDETVQCEVVDTCNAPGASDILEHTPTLAISSCELQMASCNTVNECEQISPSKKNAASAKKWSPSDIIPFPKRKSSQQRKSKKQRSEIITSSPFKNQLFENEQKKLRAENERLKKQLAKFEKYKRVPDSNNTKRNKSVKKLFDILENPNNPSSDALKIQRQDTAKGQIAGFTKKRDQPSTSSAKIQCPACEEEYKDPPDEDWIKCSSCEEWWHDACSNYEGTDKFICDYC